MEVGLRELKARLSQYVSQVADGRGIIITDRGRPVARIVPINDGSQFERGVDEGWIEPARRTHMSPANPQPAQRSVMNALDEDRG